MGAVRQYRRYVQQMRRRFETQKDLDEVTKSTAELLREEREDAEAAAAAAAESPPEHARPKGERPHKRAQWDEKQGAWVVWHEGSQSWLPYGQPGTLV